MFQKNKIVLYGASLFYGAVGAIGAVGAVTQKPVLISFISKWNIKRYKKNISRAKKFLHGFYLIPFLNVHLIWCIALKRKRNTQKLNLNGTILKTLITWKIAECDEPEVTCKMTKEELNKCLDRPYKVP